MPIRFDLCWPLEANDLNVDDLEISEYWCFESLVHDKYGYVKKIVIESSDLK